MLVTLPPLMLSFLNDPLSFFDREHSILKLEPETFLQKGAAFKIFVLTDYKAKIVSQVL